MKTTRYSKKALKFTPSGEEKAFIYQQAAELKLPVLILMEKITGDGSSYTVTFILDPVNLNLKVTGEGSDVFEACIQAKEMAKERVARTLGFSPSDMEREFLIDLIKHKISIH